MLEAASMRARAAEWLTPNVVSAVALFVALGGTSYAVAGAPSAARR